MNRFKRGIQSALLLAPAFLLPGCMQLDTHVKLNEDGTVTITERLRFSRRLLDLSGKEGSENDIASLLKKEAAEERAKHLGKGAVLISHEIKDVEGGARESVAVYKIDDLNELIYVSPFAAYKDYATNNTARFHIYPVVETSWVGCDAGDVAVTLRPLNPPKSQPHPKDGEPLPPVPPPADSQMLRDLQPMLRDVLKDFKVRLTFECYAPIRFSQLGLRGQGAGTTSIDFINFSDKDLDRFGGNFLENEELMLDLSRGVWFERNRRAHPRLAAQFDFARVSKPGFDVRDVPRWRRDLFQAVTGIV